MTKIHHNEAGNTWRVTAQNKFIISNQLLDQVIRECVQTICFSEKHIYTPQFLLIGDGPNQLCGHFSRKWKCQASKSYSSIGQSRRTHLLLILNHTRCVSSFKKSRAFYYVIVPSKIDTAACLPGLSVTATKKLYQASTEHLDTWGHHIF